LVETVGNPLASTGFTHALPTIVEPLLRIFLLLLNLMENPRELLRIL
jgi:hypothetical protein